MLWEKRKVEALSFELLSEKCTGCDRVLNRLVSKAGHLVKLRGDTARPGLVTWTAEMRSYVEFSNALVYQIEMRSYVEFSNALVEHKSTKS